MKPIMTIPLVLVCVSGAFCNRYVCYCYVIPFGEKNKCLLTPDRKL